MGGGGVIERNITWKKKSTANLASAGEKHTRSRRLINECEKRKEIEKKLEIWGAEDISE